MHAEAKDWVKRHAPAGALEVLELGSLRVNGGVRDLFPDATVYVGVDLRAGPDVDVVADAADWVPDRQYDVVVSTELLEHTPLWRKILGTAWLALKPGGLLILTCAGAGRQPHGQHGAPRPAAGEWYKNVAEADLADVLSSGWTDVVVDTLGPDLRAIARRGD